MNRALSICVLLIFMVSIISGCLGPDENIPPVAKMVASDTSIDVQEKVTFFANDSKDEDGYIKRYYWEFGDNTTGTGKYITHEYEKGGNYTVILIVTDDDGTKAVQSITIHVNEIPEPMINISLPAYIHEPVLFEANESFDPDGVITEYFWDFGDGTNATTENTNISHVYDSLGWPIVTLTVTDNEGAKNTIHLSFEIRLIPFEVTWKIDSIEIFDSYDYGENYTYEIDDIFGRGVTEHLLKNVTKTNLTQIVFNLTWVDDIYPVAGEPNDEFVMNISSPDGEGYDGEPSTEEQIEVLVPASGYLNPVPSAYNQDAESEEVLKTYIAENFTTSGGMGEWAINITILEAGGVAPGPEDFDTGNYWRLTIICLYYTPKITRL